MLQENIGKAFQDGGRLAGVGRMMNVQLRDLKKPRISIRTRDNHILSTYLGAINVARVLDLELYLDERPVQPGGSRRALRNRRGFAICPSSLKRGGIGVGLVDRGDVKAGILEFRVAQSETELEARLNSSLIRMRVSVPARPS